MGGKRRVPGGLVLMSMVSLFISCHAFTPIPMQGTPTKISSSPFSGTMLFSSTSTEEEVSSMRIGEIKKELESYGISTRSFLEKSELVDALVKARNEGLKPEKKKKKKKVRSGSDDTTEASSSSSATNDGKSRDERIKEEMEKCKSMKATEMKKELEERGISTKSFFEKSEFLKALAEARVDNVNRGSAGGSASSSEGYAEYSNVEVLTSDDAGPRKRSKEEQQQQGGGSPFGGAGGSPFGGAGGNPFGGGAAGGSPFGGGSGGMGDIADMLKNMGVGGAPGGGSNPFAGGSPFGGAGGAGNPFGGAGGAGNPFGGDAMKKAQQMMSNPKVQQIMSKAQSNPKVMSKLTECMSNPAAFAKYQNDPEVAELLAELKKVM